MPTSARTVAATLLALVTLSSCSDSTGDVQAAAPQGDASITVTSPAFEDGGTVPVRFTCDGDEVPPPLRWTGVPDDAAALALVVDDPDAPSGTFTHWVVLDILADVTSSPAGALPEGGVQGRSSAGTASYVGPCPPSGTHHYRFTVYALSRATGLEEGASLDDTVSAIDDHDEAWGRLTATYSRG